jgi:hydrogenase expression/formation protein HypD
LVPPAIEAILSSADNRVQGFLAAGHVCTIMGQSEYAPIARQYHVPIVITGFEPIDILTGVAMCVDQLEQGRAEVENPYARVVRSEGNAPAQDLIAEVFQVTDRQWRGIGEIRHSGLELRPDYQQFDAIKRLGVPATPSDLADASCIAGEVLQGIRRPADCPSFGTRCTPDNPLGAPMVSDEGACAAYYRYRRSGVEAV